MKSVLFSRMLLLAAALVISFLSSYGQDDPSGQVVGTWNKVTDMGTITLTLKADNKSEVEFNGDDVIDVYSDYEISGTEITFNDYGGDYAADVPGTYEFKVDGSSLSFTVVNDPVEGRSALVQGAWTKAASEE